MTDPGTETDQLKAGKGANDRPGSDLANRQDMEIDPARDISSPTVGLPTLPNPDPLIVENLSRGVIEKLQPGLTKSRSMLEELTENQRILIETIQQENKKFVDCHAYKEVNETMEKSKLYHAKLLNIKKEMVLLHEKSAKLKKRALRLQQQKNKEILEREQSRDVELEREKMLIAQPAKTSAT